MIPVAEMFQTQWPHRLQALHHLFQLAPLRLPQVVAKMKLDAGSHLHPPPCLHCS